ncbi:MAG: hypothetical protein QOC55_340 [Thermoleophilaceae bacterium]|nr:hypothetical protein [Thermoleophilaceae bacterium]
MSAAALAAALVFATPASALLGAGASQIDQAIQGLQSSPVYVDPRSGGVLSHQEARQVAAQIDARNAGPMYIVVMPQSAADAVGGDPIGVLRQIQSQLNRPGVYAGIIGSHFRAGATGGILPTGEAGKLATDAFNAHHGQGADVVLTDFVNRIGSARAGGGSGGSGGSGGASGAGGLILIGVIAAGIGAVLLSRRRRQRRELEQVKLIARDDLVELGDQIRALDMDVSMPNANTDAKAHYNQAVEIYQSAEQRFDRARAPQDLEPVSTDLEHGRYEMQAAQALLEGRPAPERRLPCFFDPRHGPSARDVEWAPPGGTPRPVPACAADAQRVEQGLDPNVREIQYGGQMIPYWAAPPMYTPFFGGFWGGFGGFGGFLPGMLIGEMLGGGFGGGFGGWGDGYYGDQGNFGDGGDFGNGGLGDFGDAGGGDFGGGDFGGGDFGGGGGDF